MAKSDNPSLQSACDAWNKSYPPGTLVDVIRINGVIFRSQTTGRAGLSSAGTPVVHVVELGWYLLKSGEAGQEEAEWLR